MSTITNPIGDGGTIIFQTTPSGLTANLIVDRDTSGEDLIVSSGDGLLFSSAPSGSTSDIRLQRLNASQLVIDDGAGGNADLVFNGNLYLSTDAENNGVRVRHNLSGDAVFIEANAGPGSWGLGSVRASRIRDAANFELSNAGLLFSAGGPQDVRLRRSASGILLVDGDGNPGQLTVATGWLTTARVDPASFIYMSTDANSDGSRIRGNLSGDGFWFEGNAGPGSWGLTNIRVGGVRNGSTFHVNSNGYGLGTSAVMDVLLSRLGPGIAQLDGNGNPGQLIVASGEFETATITDNAKGILIEANVGAGVRLIGGSNNIQLSVRSENSNSIPAPMSVGPVAIKDTTGGTDKMVLNGANNSAINFGPAGGIHWRTPDANGLTLETQISRVGSGILQIDGGGNPGQLIVATGFVTDLILKGAGTSTEGAIQFGEASAWILKKSAGSLRLRDAADTTYVGPFSAAQFTAFDGSNPSLTVDAPNSQFRMRNVAEVVWTDFADIGGNVDVRLRRTGSGILELDGNGNEARFNATSGIFNKVRVDSVAHVATVSNPSLSFRNPDTAGIWWQSSALRFTIDGSTEACRIQKATNPGASQTNYFNMGGAILSSHTRSVKERTADRILLGAGNDTTADIFTNVGATGVVTLTLNSSEQTGWQGTFIRAEDYAFRIVPTSGSSQAIVYSNGKMTDGKYLELTAVGSSITLVKMSTGDWFATSELGTFSEEP